MAPSLKKCVSYTLGIVLVFITWRILNTSLSFGWDEPVTRHRMPFENPVSGLKTDVVTTPDFKIPTTRTSTVPEKVVTIASGGVSILAPKKQPDDGLPKPSTDNVNITEYAKILNKYADVDSRWIVMTLIDMGCADMAVNFYMASLVPFKITNYVFIGQDSPTCAFVSKYGINCYVYKHDAAASHSSIYHSKDFLRKMNIRTYMILDALRLGYHVLHTDVDMTFMRNPVLDFNLANKSYDVAPLWDCGAYNAGFLFVRNTAASRAMYAASAKIADTEPKTDDQQALNRGIRSAQKSHGLKLQKLNTKKYLCGEAYWERQKRNFAPDAACKQCVVVHDNWIVSMEAKRYRLREMNWWLFDGDDRYYTSPDRRYLSFKLPAFVRNRETTLKLEQETLKSALAIGAILNRTVILPQFHGPKENIRQTLLDVTLVRNVDAGFADKYRESTFLTHPSVPDAVTQSQSDVHFIQTAAYSSVVKNEPGADVIKHAPTNAKTGATASEIETWFGAERASVLVFHSLYGAFSEFDKPPLGKQFVAKLKKAFEKKGGYRQF